MNTMHDQNATPKYVRPRDDARIPPGAKFIIEKCLDGRWVRMGYSSDQKGADRMAAALGGETQVNEVTRKDRAAA